MPVQLRNNTKTKRVKTDKKTNPVIMLIINNLILQIVIFLFVALVSYFSGLKANTYYLISLLSVCVGSFISGMNTGKIKKKKGLIYGMIHSLPFLILVVIVSLVMNNFRCDFTILISIFLPLIAAAAGGIFSVNYKRKIKVKR